MHLHINKVTVSNVATRSDYLLQAMGEIGLSRLVLIAMLLNQSLHNLLRPT